MFHQPVIPWSVIGVLAATTLAFGQDTPAKIEAGKQSSQGAEFLAAPTLLSRNSRPIDLASALRLAGVENPEILLARERVVEAVALRQLAAAQFLPTLNAGTNVDNHTGTLQQSTGAIINVNRGSLYLGLGAGAVGAGTVTIPGLVWEGNVSTMIFQGLAARQVVRQREFDSQAVRNQMLLKVAQAYLDLLGAEGRRAVALKTRGEASEVARTTANYAKAKQGRQSDAERAATELEMRTNDLVQAESDLATASARLCQLLGLDPSVRLEPADGWVVPNPIVPEPIPLAELLAIALTQRPELGERQAAIRAALLELRNAKVLPFSPNVIVGYSAGDFGGGSNLVQAGIPQAGGTVLQQSRFGNYADRQDFDAVVYWSLRNLGVGNLGLVRLAQSNLRQNELRNLEVLDRIRADVASAYARTHARYAQIETNEAAVKSSMNAFQQDILRTRSLEGLPIEVLDSLRLLGRSRYAYLAAIIEYNRAHFELYVALGQPPADILARPVPSSLVPPPGSVAAPR
ncbi:MAG TPA: TolC family protein [Gemmataceae bacterium]|jgi:outer membrane protein TolC|nr:TolC family protein [Gemmataceae bacterium]